MGSNASISAAAPETVETETYRGSSLPPEATADNRAHCGAMLGGNCAPASSSSSRDSDLRLLIMTFFPVC